MLRLDFNENTLGPSPKVVEAIRALTPEDYATYPEYEPLCAEFAAQLKLAPGQVGLFNGADAALRALFDAFGSPGERFITTQPTFGYYQPCADLAGLTTVAVPYEADLGFPENALRGALDTGARLCVLCNPNNPTTTLATSSCLLSLARDFPNTLFVIDEIYAPYTGVSVLPEAADTSNVVALRSMSKSSGLAALRVGFACGPEPLVSRALRTTGPYDVNAFGVIAARAALADAEWTRDYVARVTRAKQWTLAQLDRLGVRHFSQGGNYALLWPKQGPSAFARELRARGILVRDMSGKPGIEGSVRLSFGTLEQMRPFIAALEAIDA